MKKYIVAGIILLAVVAFAEEQTKYEVTIKVVYNALDIKEANKIMADAIKRHQEACTVEVEAKKVGGDYENITTIDWGGVTDTQSSVELLDDFVGEDGGSTIYIPVE